MMMRTRLAEFEAALAVAKHRNFRAAAAELGISKATISGNIQALEAKIGVLLFHRTTRTVSLTSAGDAFISRVSSSIADIVKAIVDAREQAG